MTVTRHIVTAAQSQESSEPVRVGCLDQFSGAHRTRIQIPRGAKHIGAGDSDTAVSSAITATDSFLCCGGRSGGISVVVSGDRTSPGFGHL